MEIGPDNKARVLGRQFGRDRLKGLVSNRGAFAPSLALAMTLSSPASAQDAHAPPPDAYAAKSRLFVLTDMGNEPDDQMSFVRLLVYTNDIDIEGLAATTSTHLKTATNPQTIHEIINGFGVVRPNLAKHASSWPTARMLHERVSSGPAGYGIAAIDTARPSSAALALIAAADRSDARPLWVAVWGGANTLAEALSVVRSRRDPTALEKFVSRLRVYSISDQDDAGPWVRQNFPTLRYVVSPSGPDVLDYAAATWSGIAGDTFFLNCDGADATTTANEWLEANVRKGPLGRHYLRAMAIMEGDTPSFLGLIPNGLASSMSPGWGGWGGRYVWRRHPQAGGPIWTQGAFPAGGIDSRDAVLGTDNHIHRSDQATIWRWRAAFQHDFAARMDWTVKSFGQANHPPALVVNGAPGLEPLYVKLRPGEGVTMDASRSNDPDRGQTLTYKWFLYPEAGSEFGSRPPQITIETKSEPAAVLKNECVHACQPATIHVILEVTDDGMPSLTRYRRVIVQTTKGE